MVGLVRGTRHHHPTHTAQARITHEGTHTWSHNQEFTGRKIELQACGIAYGRVQTRGASQSTARGGRSNETVYRRAPAQPCCTSIESTGPTCQSQSKACGRAARQTATRQMLHTQQHIGLRGHGGRALSQLCSWFRSERHAGSCAAGSCAAGGASGCAAVGCAAPWITPTPAPPPAPTSTAPTSTSTAATSTAPAVTTVGVVSIAGACASDILDPEFCGGA